jgi:hypothetical protein
MTHYIERDGQDIWVDVEYTWERPQAATQWEPAEGGCFIDDIICSVKLTPEERENVERATIDNAWEMWYERHGR